jgi:segregation and condensation protein B
VKPRRKKKRSRVRADAPRTRGATVETADAEPDADGNDGEVEASQGDDARANERAADAAEGADDQAGEGDAGEREAGEAEEGQAGEEGVIEPETGPGEGQDEVEEAGAGEAEEASEGQAEAAEGEAVAADGAAEVEADGADAERAEDDEIEASEDEGAMDEDRAGAERGDVLAEDEDERELGEDAVEAGVAGVEAEADQGASALARRKSILESLLFASEKPLTLKRMAELMHERQLVVVREILDALLADYQGRGIELCEVAGGWQFRTAPVNSQWVQQLVGGKPVRLSRAQLETLAIVAYRQPITRPEIDEIRGVDSGGTLKVLLDRELIRVLGKKEEPGRPLLYGTTKEFLTFFHLNDLRELPTLREYHELTEDSRRVVEARLGVSLDDLPGKGTVAIDVDGESLDDELAADLGLAGANVGQSSEGDAGPDADAGAEPWTTIASEEGAEWALDADVDSDTAPAAEEDGPGGEEIEGIAARVASEIPQAPEEDPLRASPEDGFETQEEG